MAMGMCLTGMGMLSPGSTLAVWTCRGEVLDKAADSLVCTWRGRVAEVIWGGLGRCRGEDGRAGLTGLWEKMDCMGA